MQSEIYGKGHLKRKKKRHRNVKERQ